MDNDIHVAQAAILTDLRKAKSLKFSQLSRNSPLEADSFKFHLKSLQKRKFVLKNIYGSYELTPEGKELANRIDDSSSSIRRNVKLSMLLLIRDETDPDRVLLQKRLRQPYYEYWGAPSGQVPWGVSAIQAAQYEIFKQTGYQTQPEVTGFTREISLLSEQGKVIEDKLFLILEAKVSPQKSQTGWHGGENKWFHIDEVPSLSPIFSNISNILKPPVGPKQQFEETIVTYKTEQY